MTVGGDGKLHAVAMVWSLEGQDPANDWPMAIRRDAYMHPRFLAIDLERDLHNP